MTGAAVLISLMLVSAAPQRSPIVVALSSKRSGSEELAKAVVAKLVQQLKGRAPEVVVADEATSKATTACQAATACLANVAQGLGKRSLLIGVDVGKVRDLLAVYIEAVGGDSATVLATADFSVRASKWQAESDGPIGEFLEAVTPKLTCPPELLPPVVTVKQPDVTPEPDAVDTKEAPPVRGGAIAVTAVTGAAAVTAAVLGVFTLVRLGDYKKSLTMVSVLNAEGQSVMMPKTTFTYAEVQAMNGMATGSLISALVAVAAGGLAGYLWTAPADRP